MRCCGNCNMVKDISVLDKLLCLLIDDIVEYNEYCDSWGDDWMIIDCNYIRRVKDYMPVILSRPSVKKDFLICDDEYLPIIHVECEVWIIWKVYFLIKGGSVFIMIIPYQFFLVMFWIVLFLLICCILKYFLKFIQWRGML